MNDLPLRWTDSFSGPALAPYWVGGRLNASAALSITLQQGLRIGMSGGTDYASAGVVSRVPVVGDFDARVRFAVSNPTTGTTFELAAIVVDPPRASALDLAQIDPKDLRHVLSRVYDVHGVPPYVSSEFDEGDGWRIGWNRSSAQTRPGPAGDPIADNHFNRYGASGGVPRGAGGAPASGWLRLVRAGEVWSTFRSTDGCTWAPTGEVRHMNIAPAVFLRIAAKQWPKDNTEAPKNSVVFDRFELRAAIAPATRTDLEVSFAKARSQPLASVSSASRRLQDLRGCRRCDAFWGETAAYGPFIQVDPVAGAPAPAADAARAHVIAGFSHPEPASLYGCRRAPIMLIGINPNLPAHFLVPKKRSTPERRQGTRVPRPDNWRSGAYVAMPHFSSDADYALHYRYRPPQAMQLASAQDLEGLLGPQRRIVAEADGELVPDDDEMGGSYRAAGQRKARLLIRYKDTAQPVSVPFEWSRDESPAVVRHVFAKGEIIAGVITRASLGQQVPLIPSSAGSGYYTRASSLLARIQSLIPGSKLELGEDMSLHDAVACASPNWNTRELDIDAVRANCVQDMRWMHRDLEDCAPGVVVLAGRTALALFAQTGAGRLSTPIEQLPARAGGTGGLFETVATQGLWWTYRAGGLERSVRLVVAPHFSYGDNFEPHCYLPEENWLAFRQAHAPAAELLRSEERIGAVHGTADTKISLLRDDALWPRLEALDATATATLRAAWVDPLAVLAEAAVRALRAHRPDAPAGQDAGGERPVELDAEKHLRRDRGGCDYCDNAAWKIGKGCAYDAAPAT